jgi:hypothetical protein
MLVRFEDISFEESCSSSVACANSFGPGVCVEEPSTKIFKRLTASFPKLKKEKKYYKISSAHLSTSGH